MPAKKPKQPPVDPAVRHLTASFQMLDTDGSGYLEEAEGLAIGKALNFRQPSEYWKALRRMDEDGDGRVSLDEYLKAMSGISEIAALMLKIDIDATRAKMAMNGVQPPRKSAFLTEALEPALLASKEPAKKPATPRLPTPPLRSPRTLPPVRQADRLDALTAVGTLSTELRSANLRKLHVQEGVERDVEKIRADERIPLLEGELRYAQLLVTALEGQLAAYEAAEEAARRKKQAEREAPAADDGGGGWAPSSAAEVEGLLSDVNSDGARRLEAASAEDAEGGAPAEAAPAWTASGHFAIALGMLPSGGADGVAASAPTSPRKRRSMPPIKDELSPRSARPTAVLAGRAARRSLELTAAEHELLMLRSSGVRRQARIERVVSIGIPQARVLVPELQAKLTHVLQLVDDLKPKMSKMYVTRAEREARLAAEEEAKAEAERRERTRARWRRGFSLAGASRAPLE